MCLITVSKVESFACVCVDLYVHCYVHTIEAFLFGVLTAGLIIILPFYQLLLHALAACKV